MEIERLNLYSDSSWNDLKIRFCGHSECLPLHSYGPGLRPYYLIHFVFSGKGKLIVNKKKYQVKARQLFLVEPNQMIFYQADPDDPWTYSWIGFNGDRAAYFMRRLGLGYPALTRELTPDTFDDIKELLARIIGTEIDSTANDLYINGLFFLLLSKIGNQENISRMPVKNEKYTIENYVQEAVSIVKDLYGTNLTVNDITEQLNINRSYLSTIFAQQVGTPLKKYIVDFRISRSQELLVTTNWSIDCISRLCGFSTPSYFSKIFKEYRKMSPTEYRKQRRS